MQKEGTSCIDRHRLPVQPVRGGTAARGWLGRFGTGMSDGGDPLGSAGIDKESPWLLWRNWYDQAWMGCCRDDLQQEQSETLWCDTVEDTVPCVSCWCYK